MSVTVSISDGPLPAHQPAAAESGVGAILIFEGIVRPDENGGVLEALDYDVYQPMATTMLDRLGRDVAARFGLTSLSVEHSRGRVPVGACSFRLTLTSPHRKEGLRAADEFIDRLKKDVPIWKRPVWKIPPTT